jgi:hypothetical protein
LIFGTTLVLQPVLQPSSGAVDREGAARRHEGWSRARGRSDSDAQERETSPRVTEAATSRSYLPVDYERALGSSAVVLAQNKNAYKKENTRIMCSIDTLSYRDRVLYYGGFFFIPIQCFFVLGEYYSTRPEGSFVIRE